LLLSALAPTHPETPLQTHLEVSNVFSYYYYYYYYYIIFFLLFNCNWVDTWWQQYSTHLHTNRTQNTENGKHISQGKKITITRKK
jgi:hypothetical protein